MANLFLLRILIQSSGSNECTACLWEIKSSHLSSNESFVQNVLSTDSSAGVIAGAVPILSSWLPELTGRNVSWLEAHVSFQHILFTKRAVPGAANSVYEKAIQQYFGSGSVA
ncbi:hypothetical protein JEQ12_013688 [Ovis aries]|uniref:Uncharacterized protein n=1 Tax=Ovis aries TaxID=9940 RepID=A0A836AFR6_SHEEP|nr:hypothetical protein JEQ12_013688 [Ovis aries]